VSSNENRNPLDEGKVKVGEPPTPRSRVLLLAVAVVVGVQILAAWIISLALPNWEERGQFGDMFGAVNTLFSGLALTAVAYALVLQSRELALQ